MNNQLIAVVVCFILPYYGINGNVIIDPSTGMMPKPPEAEYARGMRSQLLLNCQHLYLVTRLDQ